MKDGGEFFLTSEAAAELGISALTVRAWERRGKLKATRTRSGFRIFSAAEIERVRREREKQGGESVIR